MDEINRLDAAENQRIELVKICHGLFNQIGYKAYHTKLLRLAETYLKMLAGYKAGRGRIS